jgi:peptide/nickel transport system permease protein
MRKYVIRRFYQTIIVLWVVMTILFVLFRMMPGDPTSMLVDESLDQVARQKLLVEWGLDAPLYQQYFVFLKNLVMFNFGVSFFYRIPVWEALYSPLFNSIVLMGTGLCIAICLGILLGAYLGWKRGGKLERFGLIFSLMLRSTPIFWLGIIVLMVFAYWLALFPTGRMRVTGYVAANLFQTYFSMDFLWHLALPLLTAVLHFLSDPLLVMRTSMLEVRGEEFLEFLESMGVPERSLIRHSMKNALLPVVTFIALSVGFVFGGQVLLEVVFSWPGMGREMLLAIERRDYPIAQGSFIIMSSMVILMNFVVDLIYGYLDPRIKYD